MMDNNKTPEIIIDEEFKLLLPKLDKVTFEGLEKNILAYGVRDPLVLWNGILIDGYNRHKICTTHSLPFHTISMDFPSRDEVLQWIVDNQLGRRNLNPVETSHFRGIYFNAAKKTQGDGSSVLGKTQDPGQASTKGAGQINGDEVEYKIGKIQYKNTKTFTASELQELFLSVKWVSGNHPEKLVVAMENSSTVYSAWSNNKLIGLINAFDDSVMTVYIHFLLVRPQYQGKGIGKELLKLTLEKYKDYLRVVLVADEAETGFYQNSGFALAEGTKSMFINRF